MKNEPIKHHYIPQFILRNFCFDDSGNVLYFDKTTRQVNIKNTREIFMVKGLYCDEINSPDNRMKIEKDLSVFENEVSHIIKDKILGKDDIYITVEEDEKLKLFFAIMGFRSKNTSIRLGNNASQDTKKFYNRFQSNGNISDLWKRNLGFLVNCRSLEDVIKHDKIDPPIKAFMIRDIWGCTGTYFSVVRCSEECDCFIIGDAYPVEVNGETNWSTSSMLYAIHPISPDTAILLVSNGADIAPREVTMFRGSILQRPWSKEEDKTIRFRARKLYKEETEFINRLIEKHANDGFVFKKS